VYGYFSPTQVQPIPFLILSAGRDPDLLKPRNAALVAQGYRVAAASDSSEVVDKLLNGDFDLVLLCHTMPEEDRRRLVRIIRVILRPRLWCSSQTTVARVSQGTREQGNAIQIRFLRLWECPCTPLGALGGMNSGIAHLSKD